MFEAAGNIGIHLSTFFVTLSIIFTIIDLFLTLGTEPLDERPGREHREVENKKYPEAKDLEKQSRIERSSRIKLRIAVVDITIIIISFAAWVVTPKGASEGVIGNDLSTLRILIERIVSRDFNALILFVLFLAVTVILAVLRVDLASMAGLHREVRSFKEMTDATPWSLALFVLSNILYALSFFRIGDI